MPELYSVAIDGPSGAGKSTLAKAAAAALGICYVDTGAIYRTIGYGVYCRGIDPSDAAAVAAVLPEMRLELHYDLQRSMAKKQDVLMDGRDIGTVVLPDATVKIFLTAAPEVRAMRRCRELEQRGTPQPYEQVLRDIVDRDWADSHRDIAPLCKAEDAVELDTGALTFDESLRLLLDTIRRRAGL